MPASCSANRFLEWNEHVCLRTYIYMGFYRVYSVDSLLTRRARDFDASKSVRTACRDENFMYTMHINMQAKLGGQIILFQLLLPIFFFYFFFFFFGLFNVWVSVQHNMVLRHTAVLHTCIERRMCVCVWCGSNKTICNCLSFNEKKKRMYCLCDYAVAIVISPLFTAIGLNKNALVHIEMNRNTYTCINTTW